MRLAIGVEEHLNVGWLDGYRWWRRWQPAIADQVACQAFAMKLWIARRQREPAGSSGLSSALKCQPKSDAMPGPLASYGPKGFHASQSSGFPGPCRATNNVNNGLRSSIAWPSGSATSSAPCPSRRRRSDKVWPGFRAAAV